MEAKLKKYPLFIVLEGLDYAGKTTAMGFLQEVLQQHTEIVTTREPGGTPFGELIRDLFKSEHSKDTDVVTQAFMVNAARRHHVITKIRPLLMGGTSVISDRFVVSTLAYQGNSQEVHHACAIGMAGIYPDFTIVLDVSTETIKVRKAAANQDRSQPDWLDDAAIEVLEHRRKNMEEGLSNVYYTGRVLRINANLSMAEVHLQLQELVETELLPRLQNMPNR